MTNKDLIEKINEIKLLNKKLKEKYIEVIKDIEYLKQQTQTKERKGKKTKWIMPFTKEHREACEEEETYVR